jgi:DNA repair exonuclease SbcCD ATPase subunit
MSELADSLIDTPTTEQATPEALAEIILEIEQYRERLVNDTLTMAQRAKIMKSKALETLEPNLAQIDAQLAALRQQQADLTPSSRPDQGSPFIF